MGCGFGVRERMVGQSQSLVDSAEHPKRDSINNFHYGALILTQPVDRIAMANLIVEFDALPKIVMGGRVVAEIKAGGAGNAGNTVRDQGF